MRFPADQDHVVGVTTPDHEVVEAEHRFPAGRGQQLHRAPGPHRTRAATAHELLQVLPTWSVSLSTRTSLANALPSVGSDVTAHATATTPAAVLTDSETVSPALGMASVMVIPTEYDSPFPGGEFQLTNLLAPLPESVRFSVRMSLPLPSEQLGQGSDPGQGRCDRLGCWSQRSRAGAGRPPVPTEPTLVVVDKRDKGTVRHARQRGPAQRDSSAAHGGERAPSHCAHTST